MSSLLFQEFHFIKINRGNAGRGSSKGGLVIIKLPNGLLDLDYSKLQQHDNGMAVVPNVEAPNANCYIKIKTDKKQKKRNMLQR